MSTVDSSSSHLKTRKESSLLIGPNGPSLRHLARQVLPPLGASGQPSRLLLLFSSLRILCAHMWLLGVIICFALPGAAFISIESQRLMTGGKCYGGRNIERFASQWKKNLENLAAKREREKNGEPEEPTPKPKSRYIPPEKMSNRDEKIDMSYEERVRYDALKEGDPWKQNQILDKHINREG